VAGRFFCGAQYAEGVALPKSLIGQTLAERYVPRAIVGRGAMGVVYAADDLRAGALVAFKALARQSRDAQRVLRFEREIEVMRRLSHPSIVALHDFGWLSETEPWFVMELLDGTTLRDRLDRGPIDTRELAALLAPVASALDAIHEAGMVHRDVKPANVLFTPGSDRHVKLGDLGLALVTDPDLPRLTDRHAIVGSPAYMPPEGLKRRWTPAADVYALGVVIFEALAGRSPFDGSPAEVLIAKSRGVVPRLTEVSLRPVTTEQEALLAWALAREPSERPARATELVAALAKL
jgi:serine/threonine-protein kinase